jgi:peptidyl-tRNA hydrolase, PTH1 family
VDTNFLVVGLGNPGPKYKNTRHNLGFMAADVLAERIDASSWKEKFSAHVARGTISGDSVTLIKPQTFMNLSGRSVVRAMQFYNIEMQDIIVIHDELDLDYGTVRLKKGGGCAGHKGLLSIKQETGNTDFLRVRMGIGRPQHGSGADFVLGSFRGDEAMFLDDFVRKGADAVQAIIEQGIDKVMNTFNRRAELSQS